MSFRLSLNTNPLVNRFAAPDELIRTVAGEIGIGHIQLVHEFINPAWPAATVRRLTDAMAAACAAEGVRITSLMTGPYGRLNHFGHPDAEVRAYYVGWFERMADIAADLGCPAIGTQYAILTYADYDDPVLRRTRLGQALECWRAVAEHAAGRGLAYLFWEPMSVGRELGHTIAACAQLQDFLDAADLPVPLKAMVDIDHGDVSSPDPADTDPYAWAAAFATRSPIIHIKQSSANKGGHWPFTAAHNQDGRIVPDRLIATIREAGGVDNELCMEFAFREREPADRNVIPMIRESVAFWKPYVDIGRPEAEKTER
ncbi:sugar phosphate isomerase/epimerase family protein [Labrys monachus]|uniref:Sugar phosphate isomerase/epimerase n=1 Tax=Labrys monachus TaxID=217067 RepID=A0ABU0FM32_9HYPH|nr:TIM barrel protein [Labrys monachus]MDQ0395662.1 sugar phosphate isomerase/epimerase [Labrys monachus]